VSFTDVHALLHAVQAGDLSIEEAVVCLGELRAAGADIATLDTDRQRRTGQPEAIYGEGKSADDIILILERLHAANQDGMVTRLDDDKAARIQAALSNCEWHPRARILRLPSRTPRTDRAVRGRIAIVAAGTSDLSVAEEAAVVAETYGNPVDRYWDVGVAGIHRLMAHMPAMREASVIIVVAGMEGALASVVSGMVSAPVVAVPTSVGYGASFGGIAALLGMLNSCAAGVTVVNIDNGFGAAVMADRINRRMEDR
jgi:NCAIR mutase (PurE)-related protein